MTERPTQQDRQSGPGIAIVAAPLLVMAAIFFLSSRSQLPDLDGERDLQSLAGHFFAYAALGASLAVLFRALGWSAMRALFAAIVLATLYGITDELHQSFVPNRQTDVRDVLVDFLGACAGSLAAMQLMDWRSNRISASSDAVPVRPGDESS